MKYDDASWHYGGDFPSDLPDDAGATHIGMFLAWCLLNGLGSRRLGSRLSQLRNHEITPGQFLLLECDGKLTDEDLNVEGNAFASAYYESDEDTHQFLEDFATALNPDEELPSSYHVGDSWDNFDKLQPLIVRAYNDWRKRTPDIVSPAERFYDVCQAIGDSVKPFGYRYAKSGPQVTRRAGGFSCCVKFFEEQRFKSLDLVLEIRSRDLKAWRKDNCVPKPRDTVMLGMLGRHFGHKRQQGWNVTSPDTPTNVVNAIKDEVEPLFRRILNTREFLADAIALEFPEWELMDRIQFILCFGEHDHARQAAINWLQNNIGQLYEYVTRCEDYRDEGLVPHKGGGYAKELAHASHVFEFGDLSKEVMQG